LSASSSASSLTSISRAASTASTRGIIRGVRVVTYSKALELGLIVAVLHKLFLGIAYAVALTSV